MNRVEVFSATSPSLQARIDAPGAASVDISADGRTVWVGTTLEQILAIDTSSLQVKARYPVSAITPIPATSFVRPTEAVAMANGKLMVRLREPAGTESLLALWDPAGNTFTDLTSAAPSAFQAGLGVMARTGDQSRLLVAANDTSGLVAVLDGSGKILAGPHSVGAGSISFAAANSDGSRFAVVLNSAGASQVILLDASLNPAGNYLSGTITSLVFSRDGQRLFAAEAHGNIGVLTALSATDLLELGQIPDVAIQGVTSTIEEVDASGLICGLGNRGVSFLDAAAPVQSLSLQAVPVFAAVPAAQPAEGPNSGGTSISLTGANFVSNPQLRFGAQNPINAMASSTTQLQATSPLSAASGPVNLTAYFSNGWLALAPAAFSFGPQIEKILPNSGSVSGGDTITILGYGFGASPGSVSVTIGGQSAVVQKVESLPVFASALSLDSSYPFSLERITVAAPAGPAGKADVVLTTPSGAANSPKSFQYVATSQSFPVAGLHKFIVYDQTRQSLYLSTTDHIDLFSLATQTFGSPVSPFPGGPPPNAALRGLALSPDHSRLIAADFGGQSVYLVNPDQPTNTGVKVPVGGVAGFLNSGPSRVSVTSDSTVFVAMSGEGGSAWCSGCLGQLNLVSGTPAYEPAPQPEVTSVVGTPLLQADAAGDILYLSFGNSAQGPVASWNATAPNVFTVSSAAQKAATDLTTAADGNLFAVRVNGATEIRGSDLNLLATPTSAELENIPGLVVVPGAVLHPSGALLYEPFLDGPAPAAPRASGIRGGIDIRDARNGQLRLRVYLPEPFAMLSTDVDGLHGSFLTIDENGQQLFAATMSGLSIVKLANVPLGIGSIVPSSGAAAGGTSITLRGSGFQSATKVTIGGKAATVSFKDMNTLTIVTPASAKGPQRLVATNPDGETTSLDAAFLAQ
jgi:hypothetical protein